MADYTALYETGSALVELLRENLTPEPISKRELISLGSPLQNENSQMTVYLFHIEEDVQSGNRGFTPYSRGTERMSPTALSASFLVTAHSKVRWRRPTRSCGCCWNGLILTRCLRYGTAHLRPISSPSWCG